jgi:type 1 fimbria pilin
MFRALCLQGGGVAAVVDASVSSSASVRGTVAISSCTISGNAAANVRAHVQNFPSP